jgi:DNA repair protein RadC
MVWNVFITKFSKTMRKYDLFSVPWQVSDSAIAKMMQTSVQNLSNIELLQIIVGINSAQANALMAISGNDLNELSKMCNREMIDVNGIGKVKAARIHAMFELARRKRTTLTTIYPKIKCSQDAYRLMHPIFEELDHEEFWVILTNRGNQVIDQIKVGQGGISGTTVDVRIILNKALEKLASGLILVHNHPSGQLFPSDNDIKITKRIREAAQLLDITLLDHLIMCQDKYLSMADDNLIP